MRAEQHHSCFAAGAEGEAGAAATPAAGDSSMPAEPQGASATAPAAATAVDEAEPMDEDALLQQALAMSMTPDEPPADEGGADGGANGSVPHTEQVCRTAFYWDYAAVV